MEKPSRTSLLTTLQILDRLYTTALNSTQKEAQVVAVSVVASDVITRNINHSSKKQPLPPHGPVVAVSATLFAPSPEALYPATDECMKISSGRVAKAR